MVQNPWHCMPNTCLSLQTDGFFVKFVTCFLYFFNQLWKLPFPFLTIIFNKDLKFFSKFSILIIYNMDNLHEIYQGFGFKLLPNTTSRVACFARSWGNCCHFPSQNVKLLLCFTCKPVGEGEVHKTLLVWDQLYVYIYKMKKKTNTPII